MRHAAAVRRELKVKTVMNLLGPLINPADAGFQLIGVFDERYCLPVAQAARMLGAHRVMVVHASDGMDEISVTSPTRAVRIDETGTITDSVMDAAELGIPRFTLAELSGGSAEENAATAREILAGGGREAVREAVLVNAGAALSVCGLAGGVREGYQAARQALESGKAREKLEQIVRDGAALAAGAGSAENAA
jgi:anthranilate synthase/phosphoribosyltransferase